MSRARRPVLLHALPLALVALALAALPPAARAGEPPREQRPGVAKGRAAFAAGDYAAAREAFERELAAAREAGASPLEADLLFYVGITFQAEAQKAADPAERSRLLSEAAQRYEAALAVNPASGSSLNNLAEVYAGLERQDEAAAMFERALAVDDTRRPFFARNYAELLVGRGDAAGALRYYRMAAEGRPNDLEAHHRLLQLYAEHGRGELAGYLWGVLERGLAERAQEVALAALAPPAAEGLDREELLAVVAATLSRQYYAPQEFSQTATGGVLEALREDPLLGQGVGELFRLHSPEIGTVADYGWWASRGRVEEPPRGLWPREAFRLLARARGAWEKRPTSRFDPRRAESYLRLAIALDPDAPDPQALLELADLYYGAGRLEELDRLSREVTPRLFESKSWQYARGDWRQVYETHRVLGLIYARLGRWGDESTPDSAIFQLERARTAAARHDAAGPPLAIDPALLEQLATAYVQTGRAEQGTVVQLEAARIYHERGEAYLSQGKPAEAKAEFAKAIALAPALEPERAAPPHEP